jgi:hypothetical protein
LRKFPDDRSEIDESLSHHEAHEGHEALGDGLSKISCAAYSKGQPQGVAPTNPTPEFFVFFALFAVKYSFLRALRVLRGENYLLVAALPRWVSMVNTPPH